MKQKCIFLDRDGVLNEDRSDYVYRIEDMIIPWGVVEALQRLKEAGYMLIVITNQAGIAKGLYTREDVWNCYRHLQQTCGDLLDDLYFCVHHPDYSSRSLMRKPDSLMLEKAIAKYNIDINNSWMVGDHVRDVRAGQRVGVKTIHITNNTELKAGDATAVNLLEAAQLVVRAAS